MIRPDPAPATRLSRAEDAWLRDAARRLHAVRPTRHDDRPFPPRTHSENTDD